MSSGQLIFQDSCSNSQILSSLWNSSPHHCKRLSWHWHRSKEPGSWGTFYCCFLAERRKERLRDCGLATLWGSGKCWTGLNSVLPQAKSILVKKPIMLASLAAHQSKKPTAQIYLHLISGSKGRWGHLPVSESIFGWYHLGGRVAMWLAAIYGGGGAGMVLSPLQDRPHKR